MDELISELLNYLPIKCKSTQEDEYLSFLVATLDVNCKADKWQFAYFCIHLILMFYIHSIIKKYIDKQTMSAALSHLNKSQYKKFSLCDYDLLAHIPYVNERNIFRLLRILGIDETVITDLEKAVEYRNNMAHCNFSIYVTSEDMLISNTQHIIDIMASVHDSMKDKTIELFDSTIDALDIIEDIQPEDFDVNIDFTLIRGNYLSRNDLLTFCETPTEDQLVKQMIEVLRTDFLGKEI